jgi:hypothetical protein
VLAPTVTVPSAFNTKPVERLQLLPNVTFPGLVPTTGVTPFNLSLIKQLAQIRLLLK